MAVAGNSSEIEFKDYSMTTHRFRLERIAWVRIVLVFLLLVPGAALGETNQNQNQQGAYDFDDMGPQWAEKCFELKKHLSFSPALDVVYAIASPKLPDAPFWGVRWSGLDLPIPVADYQDLAMMADPGCDLPGFMLKSSTGTFFSAGCLEGMVEPIDDVLAQTRLFSGQPEKSVGGKALTEVLYGGPVSFFLNPLETAKSLFFALMATVYGTKSSDLHCDPLEWRDELAAAIPLILKDIGEPYAPTTAYRNVGRHQGFLVFGHRGDQNVWSAWIYDNANMNEAVNI